MLKWFRQQPPPHDAALAMIGAKTGDRILVIGAAHPQTAAALALTTGLNGETRVVCSSADRRIIETASRTAGALVEIDIHDGPGLTLAGNAFDLIVWMEPLALQSAEERAGRMHQTLTMLRPGGRVIVIDGSPASGLFKRQAVQTLEAKAVVQLLHEHGGLAARDLGTIDGLTYYEARKTR